MCLRSYINCKLFPGIRLEFKTSIFFPLSLPFGNICHPLEWVLMPTEIGAAPPAPTDKPESCQNLSRKIFSIGNLEHFTPRGTSWVIREVTSPILQFKTSRAACHISKLMRCLLQLWERTGSSERGSTHKLPLFLNLEGTTRQGTAWLPTIQTITHSTPLHLQPRLKLVFILKNTKNYMPIFQKALVIPGEEDSILQRHVLLRGQ